MSAIVNCSAQVYAQRQELQAGFPVGGGPGEGLLLEQPCRLAGPSKRWQELAAFQGSYDASLYVHARTDLRDAVSVVVTRANDTGQTGVYSVLSVQREGPEQRLDLQFDARMSEVQQ